MLGINVQDLKLDEEDPRMSVFPPFDSGLSGLCHGQLVPMVITTDYLNKDGRVVAVHINNNQVVVGICSSGISTGMFKSQIRLHTEKNGTTILTPGREKCNRMAYTM